MFFLCCFSVILADSFCGRREEVEGRRKFERQLKRIEVDSLKVQLERTLDNFLRIARVFLYRRSRGMSVERRKRRKGVEGQLLLLV